VEPIKLEIDERSALGTSSSKKFRREGMIPCVVTTRSSGPIHAILKEQEFVKAAEKSLPSQIFTVDSESEKLQGKHVVVKEIQKNPIANKVLHVDLQILEEGGKVKIRVPLEVFGEARGVKLQGGILTTQAREIVVRASADKIPSKLRVDVSDLGLGKRILASDIELSEGVTLASDPKQIIANIVASRSTKLSEGEEEAAAGAVAGAAPAAAEPAAAKKPEKDKK